MTGVVEWYASVFPSRASPGMDNTRPLRTLARERNGRGEKRQKPEKRSGRREEEEEGTLETMKSSLDICEDS